MIWISLHLLGLYSTVGGVVVVVVVVVIEVVVK